MKRTESNSGLLIATTEEEATSAKLEEIASFLQATTQHLPASPGLSNGSLGAFLFLYTYAEQTANEEYAATAQSLLLTAVQNLFSYPSQSPLYHREVAEIGTIIQYLQERTYLDDTFDVVLEKIDELLRKGLPTLIHQSLFDPFTGYLYAGQYMLSRGQQGSLHQILDALLTTYEPTAQGGYWRSFLFGKDQVYTGWSHGVAAILLFLSHVVTSASTYRREELTSVMHGASQYLLANQLTDGLNQFPDVVNQRKASSPMNLCYGDLGTGYALLKAGQALVVPSLQDAAMAVLVAAAQRRGSQQCQVPDASLIYGASGNALFFQQLYQTTHTLAFQEAAGYWRQQMELLSQHPECVAGYRSHYNQHNPHTQYSLFEGVAGYGLSLLEYEFNAVGLLPLIGY